MIEGFDRISRYIDEHEERFVEELFTLLAIPTLAPGEDTDRYIRTIERYMIDAGCSVSVFPTEGMPIIYGSTVPDGEEADLLVYGHYDVMPAEEDDWTSPPFAPAIRGRRIYARGVGDNKGQHFAHLKALESIARCGFRPPRVKFIFEGEEESGSASLAGFLSEHGKLLRARWCYAADGPRDETNSPTLSLGARGLLAFDVNFSNRAGNVHSGNRGNIVPSPVWRMVEFLNELKSLFLLSSTNDVGAATDAELQAIASLPFDGKMLAEELGIDEIAHLSGQEYYERLMYKPALNISGVLAGYNGEGYKTIIPSQSSVRVDIRLVPNQDPEVIYKSIMDLVQDRFPDARVELLDCMRPYRLSHDSALVSAVEETITGATGKRPIVWPSAGGTSPQSVFHDELGIPCLWNAYANWDEGNHGPDENLDIDLYLEGIKQSAAIFLTSNAWLSHGTGDAA